MCESAIASSGNGICLSPEDLEFELSLGEQQLFTDLGKSVYLHLVVALGRGRCHSLPSASGHCGSNTVMSTLR
ncbi:hypothetical protein E4U17_003240 [Claviceps sp. LM77 group G4]|nr:hypothetical protein E4U17_003240 [Claviceps sp. LM77 group G4]KAG6075513.1 hypothetical protein E4U16_003321 [Claviceps sp. LM84 group G4]